MPSLPRRSLTSRTFFRDPLSPDAGFRTTLSHLIRLSGRPSRVSGFLTRGAVLFGMLAVIAGIFGMHVMTGSHASHAVASHTDGRPAAHWAAGDGHAHSAAAHTAAADDGEGQPGGPAHPGGDAAVVLADGVCAEMCPGAGERGASCVPSPASGALTVVAPPSAVAQQPRMRATGAATAYSHVPSSPTPCELSISRT